MPCFCAYVSENSDCSATFATANNDLSRNLDRNTTSPAIHDSAYFIPFLRPSSLATRYINPAENATPMTAVITYPKLSLASPVP